jgi:hypothetical protein
MTYTEQRLVIAASIDLWLRLDAIVHDERQRIVRVDDMAGSCGITSYSIFSAVRYCCSVGAMDMMDLRCGLQASYHFSRLQGKREAGKSAA